MFRLFSCYWRSACELQGNLLQMGHLVGRLQFVDDFFAGRRLRGAVVQNLQLHRAIIGDQYEFKLDSWTINLLNYADSLVYEIIAIVNWTIFFWLAMKWAEISKELYEMENVLINYEHTTDLRKQFMWILSFFLATALSIVWGPPSFIHWMHNKVYFQWNIFCTLLKWWIR